LTGKNIHLSLIYEREREMRETLKKKDFPEVDIYKAWCKACGICAAFCPTGAITRDEAGYPHVDPDKCIRCGWCEIRCPDFAITVGQKNEEEKKVREPFEKKGQEGTLTTRK
jgi:2-oxoglutarate ferredoxin oxidoreductase subunit delta